MANKNLYLDAVISGDEILIDRKNLSNAMYGQFYNGDLNNLKTSGTYYVNTSLNIPEGTYGFLIVITYDTTPRIKQLFIRVGTQNFNENNMYQRSWNGTSWGSWYKYAPYYDFTLVNVADFLLESSTNWQLCDSFTLGVGSYLINYGGGFGINANGIRGYQITNSATAPTSAGRSNSVLLQTTDTLTPTLNGTHFVKATSETTYYLWAYQNSGASIRTYPFYRYWQLG